MTLRDNPAEASGASPVAVAALGASMLLASLGISIVSVALPALSGAFGVGLPALQWTVLAYLLAVTVASPAAGALGDRFGGRRVLASALLAFALASAVATAAPAFPVLIAARTGQGLAAAFVLALAIAMVRASVPAARTGRAMGLLGTMSAVGTALGPSLGGVLLAAGGWRTIFAVLVPLALVAALMVARHLPPGKSSGKAAGRIDLPAASALTFALGLYASALTRANPADVTGGLLLCAAAGAFVLFLRVRQRPAGPGETGARPGLVANVLVATTIMATLVVGPFYLTGALHLGSAATGLVMTTGPVVSALSGLPAGRLTDRFGAAAMVRAGLVLMGLATAGLAVLPGLVGVPGYVAALVCLTPGYQLFLAANNTAVMVGVGAERRGATAANLSLSRNLGLVTGASLMGAVFAAAAGPAGLAHATPGALDMALRVTFGLAAGLVFTALAVVVLARRGAEPSDQSCTATQRR
ncbi:MFS transporter [Acuticoccus sp. MNP-M23]|uniref:MFS transporter n=1 Tax=Acuticoccus sp. MNP-M23 TaxID=3072793 RepID=UPI002815D194|nr:MFS transporter [Acuticoccus sp. MNP-M23]WMS41472.1 MFS transporter [Acuticoccus sp. MNP-M23]